MESVKYSCPDIITDGVLGHKLLYDKYSSETCHSMLHPLQQHLLRHKSWKQDAGKTAYTQII